VLQEIIAANVRDLPIHTFYGGPRSGDDWTIGKPLLERIAELTGGRFGLGFGLSGQLP
jgi:hypothetical protein